MLIRLRVKTIDEFNVLAKKERVFDYVGFE